MDVKVALAQKQLRQRGAKVRCPPIGLTPLPLAQRPGRRGEQLRPRAGQRRLIRCDATVGNGPKPMQRAIDQEAHEGR